MEGDGTLPARAPIRALDVSSLARWTGTPTGMLRVEHELATHALQGGVEPVVFDGERRAFRRLRREWRDRVLAWTGSLLRRPPRAKGWRGLAPSRLSAIMALEDRRLVSRSPALRRALDAGQRLILSLRAAPIRLTDEDGRRRDLIPFERAVGEAVAFGPGDALLSASSDWRYGDPAVLRGLNGARLAVLCFDIIPLTHPQFYAPAEVERFRRHWDAVFAAASTVIVNARCVAADVAAYCESRGVTLENVAVVPLGCAPPGAAPRLGQRPDRGLRPGRYALFVSTIEPRKNHALLLAVWRRLLAAGVPQGHDFKLVFVGRRGWMVDAVLAAIDGPDWDGTLRHFDDVGDAELWHLYEEAAFCLYPSRTEGFGLPVVEAMARGKAVIASTGGALPETVGGRAPCLDPDDVDGWTALIGDWIAEPERVAEAEARIRAAEPFPTWEEVSRRILSAAGLSGEADGAA